MLTKWPTRSWQTARGGGIEVLNPLALSAAGRSTASTIQTRVSHAPQPMLAFQRRSEDAAASPPTVVSRTLDVAHQARSPPWAMACDGSTLRSSGDHSRAAPRPRCLLEAHMATSRLWRTVPGLVGRSVRSLLLHVDAPSRGGRGVGGSPAGEPARAHAQ